MISLSFAGRFVNSFLMAKGTFGVDKLFFKLYNFFIEEEPVLFLKGDRFYVRYNNRWFGNDGLRPCFSRR